MISEEKDQINDEILAYRSLVPNGRELVATVMVEIDSPIKRAEFLSKMGGFEEQMSINIGDHTIKGKAELDGDRTTADGKASSVHFLHFDFDDNEKELFAKNETEVLLGFDHQNYHHVSALSENIKASLVNDFDLGS